MKFNAVEGILRHVQGLRDTVKLVVYYKQGIVRHVHGLRETVTRNY